MKEDNIFDDDMIKEMFSDLEKLKTLMELPDLELAKMDPKKLQKNLGFRDDFDWTTRFNIKGLVKLDEGYFCVSTVDLGLDHNFIRGGKPLYYETMIFPANIDGTYACDTYYCDRHSTEEEALEMHNIILEKLKTNRYIIDNETFEFI